MFVRNCSLYITIIDTDILNATSKSFAKLEQCRHSHLDHSLIYGLQATVWLKIGLSGSKHTRFAILNFALVDGDLHIDKFKEFSILFRCYFLERFESIKSSLIFDLDG